MTCIRCKHQEAKRFGFYGRNKIQRHRCPSCKSTFSEPRRKPLGRHYISTDRAAEIVTLLLEGMSVRAVSRVTEAHQGTILSLLLTVGEKCRNLFNSRVRGIHPRFVQADELWTFVHTKADHLSPDDPMKAAVDLYMFFFNFCRVHGTLRVTPAMQSHLTNHIWSIEELLTTQT